jgi:alpha-tubulin suppressor-like RCC1 family protein
LLGDGTVDCWGDNRYGQLGIGTQDTDPHSAPETVARLNSVKQISVTGMAPCALSSDGHVWCWGNNSYDQLGSVLPSGQTLSTSPLEVAGVSDGSSISGSCVVTVSGTLICWGFNTRGELGLGDDANPVPYVATPTAVPNLFDIAEVTQGGDFDCAVNKSGQVLCAGDNQSGELGQGTATIDDIRKFVPVKALSNIKQIEAGDTSVCALNDSGELFCWGMNAWGQLGRGNTHTAPVYPATIEPVKWQ